jgi:hypothetical protein
MLNPDESYSFHMVVGNRVENSFKGDEKGAGKIT